MSKPWKWTYLGEQNGTLTIINDEGESAEVPMPEWIMETIGFLEDKVRGLEKKLAATPFLNYTPIKRDGKTIKDVILAEATWVHYDSLEAQLDMRHRCAEAAEKFIMGLSNGTHECNECGMMQYVIHEQEKAILAVEEENRALVMEVEGLKGEVEDLKIQLGVLDKHYEASIDRYEALRQRTDEEKTELLIANKQHMEKILTMGQVMDTLVRKLGETQRENEFLSLAQKSKLTNRQAEVLRSLKDGMTVDEIAEAMGIEKGSVVWHKNKLFKKLGVGTTGEAVKMVAERRRWDEDF